MRTGPEFLYVARRRRMFVLAELITEDRQHTGDYADTAAWFSLKRNGFPLCYRIELAHVDELTGHADPFISGLIRHAMMATESILVDGFVSPSLLRNLEHFQQVEISAAKEVELEFPLGFKAIVGFSELVSHAIRRARQIDILFGMSIRLLDKVDE